MNLEDQLHHLRRVCDLIQNMAFLHLMKDEADAGKLAVEAVRTLMRFPFWDFFMEGDLSHRRCRAHAVPSGGSPGD